jgi:hypothetical protein
MRGEIVLLYSGPPLYVRYGHAPRIIEARGRLAEIGKVSLGALIAYNCIFNRFLPKGK